MSGDIKTNYLYFRYDSDVDTESRDVIKNYVKDLIKKSKNKEFFSNINVFINKDLKKSSLQGVHNKKLIEYLEDQKNDVQGLAINPALNNDKLEIFLKIENSVMGLFDTQIPAAKLKYVTAHELGHLFDYYYGANHNSKTVSKLSNFNIPEAEWDRIAEEYMNNCNLSDSEEFKKAWKADVESLGQLSYLERKYTEYKLGYSNPTNYSKIDITDGIDDNEMALADIDRSETFAQLFSYALGNEANGIEDEEYTKNIFKNTYIEVKKYIEKFLGVDVN